MYSTKPSSALIVEALFGDMARARKAIDFGIKVKDIIYQASLLNATAATALTRVQLDFLSIPNCDMLVSDLIQSVQYCDDFFEGLVSVLVYKIGSYYGIHGNKLPVKPICRILYLLCYELVSD
ncbi:hypothetical protein RMATCC62417_10200 [Rhizopus microsporus]|nr:hypothetical protein RMATCC62417_10200 [Rhizopus microsporus]